MTSPAKLEGVWWVESLAIGGELQPTLGARRLTLQVDSGRVSGNTGLNRFAGRLGDDSLFDDLVVTNAAGPHELMAQEEIYLGHLGSADDFEESPKEIFLLCEGLITVTLRPVSSNAVRRDRHDTL